MTGLSSLPILYTIYETTNLVNGKTYIGKHITTDPNDLYLGSGKLLKAAIDKYGEEWFEKTVLFVFDSEEEMNQKESELVTEEFCSLSSNYNLCPGGKGGWGYINSNKDLRIAKNINAANKMNRAIWNDEDFRKRKSKFASKQMKQRHRDGLVKYDTFTGKKHSDETKKRMSEKAKLRTGEKSSGFGSMWITNGIVNQKIKKTDLIPEGWYKGRKI